MANAVLHPHSVLRDDSDGETPNPRPVKSQTSRYHRKLLQHNTSKLIDQRKTNAESLIRIRQA